MGDRVQLSSRSRSCAAGLAIALLLLAGCSAKGSATATTVSGRATPTTVSPMTTTTSSPVPTTTASPVPTATQPIPTATVNDLKANSAHHDVAVDGEGFKLKVDYWTTIDAATWGAIGGKNVHLLAYVDPAADIKPPDVLVDEFDAQYSLLAANSGLDGLVTSDVQDRVDSAIPGFLITAKISYGMTFPAAGVSQALVQRWQALGGPMPVEEAALQRAGVYAVRVSFAFRLLVRSTGDLSWHRRTVLDQLTVPVKAVRVAASSTG